MPLCRRLRPIFIVILAQSAADVTCLCCETANRHSDENVDLVGLAWRMSRRVSCTFVVNGSPTKTHWWTVSVYEPGVVDLRGVVLVVLLSDELLQYMPRWCC